MRTSIHLGYILGTLPLTGRFLAARQLGFNAVEFPFPYDVNASDYAHYLQDNDLQQISIGAPACNYRAGEPGFSITPALQAQFDRSIDTVIEYATQIDCPNVHVFAGRRADDVAPELAFETYCRNLQVAHDRLQQSGLRLVIEAINATDFPHYFIDRLERAVEAIEQMHRPGIGIIMDVYHATVNGEDPATFLRQHGGNVAHIQLADFPGRHEPGTGMFDFAALLSTVKEQRYQGSIGLEYVPTRSVFDGVPLADLLFEGG
jgi:hydroxypyruvate isomerase